MREWHATGRTLFDKRNDAARASTTRLWFASPVQGRRMVYFTSRTFPERAGRAGIELRGLNLQAGTARWWPRGTGKARSANAVTVGHAVASVAFSTIATCDTGSGRTSDHSMEWGMMRSRGVRSTIARPEETRGPVAVKTICRAVCLQYDDTSSVICANVNPRPTDNGESQKDGQKLQPRKPQNEPRAEPSGCPSETVRLATNHI